MHKARILYQLSRYFGLRWVIFRLSYSLKLHSGYLRRRLPIYDWSERPLADWLRPEVPSSPVAFVEWRRKNCGTFFFNRISPQYPFAKSQPLIVEAESILAGHWSYFTGSTFEVGMPPNWHCNPLTGQSVPADRHWTQISDFDTGDIKYIWEASRFSIVYTLVRAFAATHDPKYALAFWELVENWAKHNPPQRGPNWKCGQEASFRVMAWCFGLYAFIDHTTPERVAQFVAMIAAHGERIERNIDYARSQNNNHGISEGVGLWTIGILFPELRSAKRWTALGKQVIESEIRRQVYADGSYAQYSPNYQRVMLHDVIWALRLGELNNNHFSPDIYQKVAISTNFLLGILDPESGRVPNHGANDSALVLPLNSASPDDFRPVIQTAYYLVNKKRLSTEGDEDIFWLFGKDALSSPLDHPVSDCQKLSANIGGYYTLRGDDSWLMVRCARYRARPHHADQLHVDFWWRGINICCDAGTYLYNGDSPWQNGLVTTAVHNTVTVDDQDQMTHFGHFLWLDWSQGIVHHHEETYWEGSHNGYRRLNPPVTHRRSIQRLDDVWIIADELQSTGNHRYCLHWLIPTLPYRLIDNTIILDPPAGHFFVYCSHPPTYKTREHDHVAGWRSLTYGHKEPALSFYITTSDEKYARFWTILSPKPLTIDRHNHPNIVLINGTEVKLFRLSFQADL